MLLLLLLLMLPAGAATQGPKVLWEDRFPWPVHWVVVGDSGVILIGSDHGSFVQAYDGRRWSRLWQRSARAGLWSPPALQGATAFLSPHDRSVLSLDLETGDLLWRSNLSLPLASAGLPGSAPPLNRAPPLPLAKEVAVISLEGQVSILSSDGVLLRQTDLQPGRFHPDRFWAAPAALDGILYAATINGVVWRVQLQDLGQSQRLTLAVPGDRGLGYAAREVRAPIVALHDRILVTTMDGTLHAFEPGAGRAVALWSTTLGPPGLYQCSSRGLALGAPVPDPVAPLVYLGLRDRVVAVGTAAGQVVWERALDEKVETQPARWREQLLVGLKTGRLLALDGGSGATLWSLDLPGLPTAGPTVWGDQVFLGFADGTVRCYDLSPLAPGSPSPSASSSPTAMRIPR